MNILSNTKMGQLVLGLFGKKDLPTDKDGKIVLTDEEKNSIRANYGQQFLDKFMATDFSAKDATSARTLFDEAVAYATKEKDTTIAKLQSNIMALMNEPEPAPKANAVTGKQAPAPINMAASHNKLVASVMASGHFAEISAIDQNSLDVTDLNKEFKGTMPTNAKLELLSKRIYTGFEDAKHMTRIQSNTDFIASAALFTEVSQQFTPVWTPKGSGKFTPSRIPYRRHKINVRINPTDLLQSWLMYLYEQGKTLAEMPITKYLISEHVLPKVLDDITLSMLGKGKFQKVEVSSLTEGSEGSAAKDSMDGIETILVEGQKTDGCNMHFYKTAQDVLALSGQTLLDYVDGFVDAISENFAGNMPIHCSPELLTRYQRADFAINGKYTGEQIGTAVRFTKFTLVPLQCMYGSPILFATPTNNLVELVDYSKAESCISKIEESHYNLDLIGEYSLSVGFKIQEAVWASVPKEYDPSAKIITGETASNKWQNGTASPEAASATDIQEGA